MRRDLLQAFQALVWALAASCAFSLLLLALIDAAGERVNLVVVLNNGLRRLVLRYRHLHGTAPTDIDALTSAATGGGRRVAVAHRAGQRGGLRRHRNRMRSTTRGVRSVTTEV